MLNDAIEKLPPELKREVADYVEFLILKHAVPRKQQPLTFAWAGCLSHLREAHTAVDLQHQASELRRMP